VTYSFSPGLGLLVCFLIIKNSIFVKSKVPFTPKVEIANGNHSCTVEDTKHFSWAAIFDSRRRG